MAKFILFPSNQLQRHVTVFLWRIAYTLILSHFKCLNQFITSIFRKNDFIDIALFSCTIRIREFLLVFFYSLSFFFRRSFTIQNIHSTVCSHYSNFSCRIREVHISTNRFTIHNDVCTSVSLTCNYCYLRNSSFCISVYNLCTVTDNTIVFLCTSWQESRYIFECYNRNIETVAETDETRSLVRSVNIKHTCQICRLIGNDTYRTSTQTSKTDYNILCKVRHNLEEIMIVDYRFDDVFDIIWHVRVVRNNCHQ